MTEEQIKKQIKTKTKRVCRKCGNSQLLKNFHIKFDKGKPTSYRFNSPCKTCFKEVGQTRGVYLANYSKKKLFGITQSEYNQMLVSQNYCCAICGINSTTCHKALAIDHNHATGKIRGLLCINCNLGIGNLKDNIDIMLSAIEYIKRQ